MERKEAVALGLRSYVSLYGCTKCGGQVRLTRTNKCLACDQRQRAEREALIQRGRSEVLAKARAQAIREVRAELLRLQREEERERKKAEQQAAREAREKARRAEKAAATRARRKAEQEQAVTPGVEAQALPGAVPATPSEAPSVALQALPEPAALADWDDDSAPWD